MLSMALTPRKLRLVFLVLLGIGLFIGGAMAFAQDAGGADTPADDPSAAVNFTWTLMDAFLVFFMQAGFAFLGAGLIRSKNTVNYMTKSFSDSIMP